LASDRTDRSARLQDPDYSHTIDADMAKYMGVLLFTILASSLTSSRLFPAGIGWFGRAKPSSGIPKVSCLLPSLKPFFGEVHGWAGTADERARR